MTPCSSLTCPVALPAGDAQLLVSLRDLFDAVAEDGAFGGAADPITGLPYKLHDRMPRQTLRDCLHWLNHPQVTTGTAHACRHFSQKGITCRATRYVTA